MIEVGTDRELRRNLRVRSRVPGARRYLPRKITCVHTSPPECPRPDASGGDVRPVVGPRTTRVHRSRVVWTTLSRRIPTSRAAGKPEAARGTFLAWLSDTRWRVTTTSATRNCLVRARFRWPEPPRRASAYGKTPPLARSCAAGMRTRATLVRETPAADARGRGASRERRKNPRRTP